MKKSALSLCLALLIAIQSSGQQNFPVTSVVDAPTIAARPVALDAQRKLPPWRLRISTSTAPPRLTFFYIPGSNYLHASRELYRTRLRISDQMVGRDMRPLA